MKKDSSWRSFQDSDGNTITLRVVDDGSRDICVEVENRSDLTRYSPGMLNSYKDAEDFMMNVIVSNAFSSNFD